MMKAGPILAVGPTTDPKLILRSLDEGANHYVDETDLDRQLEVVLARLHSRGDSVDDLTVPGLAFLRSRDGSRELLENLDSAGVVAGILIS